MDIFVIKCRIVKVSQRAGCIDVARMREAVSAAVTMYGLREAGGMFWSSSSVSPTAILPV
jgi:hypothetical protein